MTPVDTAYVIDVARTPVGKRGGALQAWHPVDLAAVPLRALVERHDLDPARIEDVILGCTMQVGEQALNVARYAGLAAGFPDTVPGTTLDRACGSAQQAITFGAQAILAGSMDLVLAGGVECMTRVPMGSSIEHGPGLPHGTAVNERYAPGGIPHQGISAEMIAERWDISREEMDRAALESHRRAAEATAEGRFAREIVPVPRIPGDHDDLVTADEGIRATSTLEKLASLPPAFKPDGRVTAATSSQVSDGATGVLLASERAVRELGLVPRARLAAFALAATDPVIMLTAPIPATTQLLERTGMRLDDIDVVELNEAFASVVLAWQREHPLDPTRLNPNGGAMAIGHPTGSTGGRLLGTLIGELERTGGRWGLQTICEGGGMANALLVERLG